MVHLTDSNNFKFNNVVQIITIIQILTGLHILACNDV